MTKKHYDSPELEIVLFDDQIVTNLSGGNYPGDEDETDDEYEG